MDFISDAELEKIPIKDNGEEMIMLEESSWLKFEIGTYISEEGENYVRMAKKVRSSVAEKLKRASLNLPRGFMFLLRCGYRPLELQKKIYMRRFNELKKEHFDWSDEKIKEETSKFVAPVDKNNVPPHSTGGTVDISIIDESGEKLDMGTRFGDFTDKANTYSEDISEEARRNRKMLINVLSKEGFVNYPLEWWHWSYGDRYWAAELKKEFAIYGSV